jgi:uncharacterized membrane protein YkgB
MEARNPILRQSVTPFARWAEGWLERHAVTVLRINLGVVFLWFGLLKYFPGMSPAEALAGRTISALTIGLVPPAISMPLLATWECVIGLRFILDRDCRWTLALTLAQMAGTVAPLFLYPREVFSVTPIAPTLEGQYIIKNLVLVGGALVVAASDGRKRRPASAALAEGVSS